MSQNLTTALKAVTVFMSDQTLCNSSKRCESKQHELLAAAAAADSFHSDNSGFSAFSCNFLSKYCIQVEHLTNV